MKKVLFLSALINCFTAFSQEKSHKIIGFDPSTEKDQSSYLKNYQSKIVLKYDSLFGKKKWHVDFSIYIRDHLLQMREREIVYQNWPEASSYLNKLIKQTLKDKWKDNIEIQICRSPDINAFVIEDGKIYMNVGLLAESKSEAELANIIGHEFGHYIMMHYYEYYREYKKMLTGTFMNSIIGYPGAWIAVNNIEKNYYAHSREHESAADDLAAQIVQASDFDLSEAVNYRERMVTIENKNRKEVNYTYENLYSLTHPTPEDRLKILKKRSEEDKKQNKKRFIIDSLMFINIKQQAIDETIYLHIFFRNYRNAIESAYKQVLLNPKDVYYVDLLIEAITKYLTRYPENSSQNFITENYHLFEKYYPKDKKPKYYKGRTGLLSDSEMCKLIQYQHQFILFNNNEKDYEVAPKSFLTFNDTIEFITNKEALDFFTGYSKKIDPKK